MIDTILFDLDGTLVHHGHVLLPERLAEWGYPRNLDEVQAAFQDQIRWAYEYLNGNKRAGDSPAFWLTFYGRVLDQLTIGDDTLPRRMAEFFAAEPVPPLFDDVLPLLAKLDGHGWQLGIVTQRRRSGTERFLQAHGLRDRFHVVVAGDDGYGRKPDPEPFYFALGQIDREPGQAIFVGDRLDDDCGGAAGAGLAAFLIDREDFYADPGGEHSIDLTDAGPEFVRLASLTELLPHLSALPAIDLSP